MARQGDDLVLVRIASDGVGRELAAARSRLIEGTCMAVAARADGAAAGRRPKDELWRRPWHAGMK